MHDFLQPYLNDIVTSVLGLVAALIVYVAVTLRNKVQGLIGAHTSSNDRTILHLIASEAVAYAATVFKEQNGPQKLESALDYVNTHLKPYGVSFTKAELRGVIEKAYADYQAKVQTPTVTNATVSVSGQTDAKQASDAVIQALKGKYDTGAIGTSSTDLQK